MTGDNVHTGVVQFLLVEDNADHADLIFRAMATAKIPNVINHLAAGDEVLPYLRRQPPYQSAPRPDVILLDLKLPGMDGHEIMKIIKSDPDLQTIPLVVLTTSDADRDRDRAAKAHANSYLVKPVGFAEFQKMIQDLSVYWAVWNRPEAMRMD